MKRGVDYIGVGVGSVILDDDGRVFLARRGVKAKNENGKWECPGGSVEFGETCAESLEREMLEELDIDIETVRLLDVCDHIILDERQHWVSPTYICKIRKGTPKIMEPDKCSEIGWFTLEEALELPLTITGKNNIKALISRRDK